jgi:hypothetical protein
LLAAVYFGGGRSQGEYAGDPDRLLAEVVVFKGKAVPQQRFKFSVSISR